ncbi:MAG: hypothetical protein LC109_01295 [Bacteroidia bacterium]|nr:hypothetical protein [Bacteroidia bacterium]MCZ2128882.1 hypothetical protein [Bacteroidia bacterium]
MDSADLNKFGCGLWLQREPTQQQTDNNDSRMTHKVGMAKIQPKNLKITMKQFCDLI